MTDTLSVDTVHVPLGNRAYDILIGPGLLANAGALIRETAPAKRAAIVTDETVAGLHLAGLRASLAVAGFETHDIVVRPGEGSKRMATLERVLGDLLEARIERGDLVVAFGGGVVGDLAGFAAAVLRRGVRFVQVPTSLLAQVDSSVGGKTGINTGHGKNLIGAFHQPALVIADLDVLDTLSPREFRAGYAELVKYGLLGDAAFFERLDAGWREVFSGGPLRGQAVAAACAMKARIVVADEREDGERALLNLGHTFGHALEAAAGYSGRLLHGEAVAIGMRQAFDFSAGLGLCSGEDARRVEAHLKAVGLPTRVSDIAGGMPDAATLMGFIAQDKKVRSGRLTFILTRGIGQAFVADDVAPDAVLKFLEAEAR